MATVFENLFPLSGLIPAGNVLRRAQFAGGTLLTTSDRPVHFIFIPAMLPSTFSLSSALLL